MDGRRPPRSRSSGPGPRGPENATRQLRAASDVAIAAVWPPVASDRAEGTRSRPSRTGAGATHTSRQRGARRSAAVTPGDLPRSLERGVFPRLPHGATEYCSRPVPHRRATSVTEREPRRGREPNPPHLTGAFGGAPAADGSPATAPARTALRLSAPRRAYGPPTGSFPARRPCGPVSDSSHPPGLPPSADSRKPPGAGPAAGGHLPDGDGCRS